MEQNTEPPRFENILNFRDVGLFINNYTGTNKLKTGLFFRSARPDGATAHDRNLLLETYKMHTIIDLRTKSEHIQQAKKHSFPRPHSHSRSSSSSTSQTPSPQSPQSHSPPIISAEPLAPSNTHAATPLKIPGLTYSEINLNGSNYSLALLKKLRYWSLAKLLALMATGYRIPAIAILGSEVMASRGLVGLAEDSLLHCGGEMLQIFTVLARGGEWPVMVHCTQGKDRTGLVVLLVLMLLGVERGAVEADYRLSEGELEPEREGRLKEIREIGLPDSFAECPPDWIERVWAFVESEFGGVEKYLLKCGVTEEMQMRVKEILLA